MRFFASQPRICGFVTSYRRSWPVARKPNRRSVVVGTAWQSCGIPLPITRLASYTSVRHGERRPSPNTSPRLSQPALLVHFFLPPATSVQCITHPPHTRAGVLQCPARPRHCADYNKPIRLGCPKDHSAPYHPPRCVFRAHQRGAHSDVVRSHDRVVDQMGNHHRGCVRCTCLVFRDWEWRRCHSAGSYRDGVGYVERPVARRRGGRLSGLTQ